MALLLAMTLSISLPPPEALSYHQPPKRLRQAEWTALAAINQLRTDRGLKPLRMAHRVRLAARARSRDMRAHDYLSHTSPTGRDAATLLARRNARYSAGSENIGRIHFLGWSRAAVGVVDAWFGSPGHRASLMSKRFDAVGIGAARDGDAVYWTAIFVRQKGRKSRAHPSTAPSDLVPRPTATWASASGAFERRRASSALQVEYVPAG